MGPAFLLTHLCHKNVVQCRFINPKSVHVDVFIYNELQNVVFGASLCDTDYQVVFRLAHMTAIITFDFGGNSTENIKVRS